MKKINLKNNSFKSIAILGIVFGVIIGLSVGKIQAFLTASTSAPTNPSNMAFPLSPDSIDQAKAGGLSLGNLKDPTNDPQTTKICTNPAGSVVICKKP